MTEDVLPRLNRALGTRYRVETELGRGGMALVFLAQDLRHGRRVALKLLRPDLAAAVGAERFLREIQLVAPLSHPHILALHDSGEADGLLYFVMPYVEGGSLRDLLNRQRRVSVSDAVAIGHAVALALDYAHRHGVVHRDIKPENIMLNDGVAMVSDFGIGKAVSADTGADAITHAGVAIGTPAYMSPEQVSGETALDGRSDLYALGCVLYEMVTGEQPFSGTTALAVMAKRVTEPAPRLTTVAPHVPPSLEHVVRKALATDPKDRYGTGAELAQALLAAQGTGAGAAVDPVGDRGIAVLPFDNMSGDPENEYLSDGLSEELTHALARVPGLRVVARTSAFAFKGKHDDVRKIGDQLGVSSVLSGSVRRAGNRVRITAQLVDTAKGFERWSARYDREMTDLFAVQDEITSEIVETLKVTLLGEVRRHVTTVDPIAYQQYLRGRQALNRRTEQSLRDAVGLLKRAVELDPRFAHGHSALAEAFLLQAIYGVEPPLTVGVQARHAAERALELDATLAEAFTSLGCLKAVVDWDWAGAWEAFRRALELAPTHSTAHHWMGVNLLAPQGRFEEALAALAHARELDPVSPTIGCSVGFVLFVARDYPLAAATLEDVVAKHGTVPLAQFFLGQVYAEMDRPAEAERALRSAVTLTGRSSEAVAALAYALGRAGRPADAQPLLEELVTRSAERYVSPVHLAWASVGTGDLDGAMGWLCTAGEGRATQLIWLAVRPQLDALRTDPRFPELEKLVGLNASVTASTAITHEQTR